VTDLEQPQPGVPFHGQLHGDPPAVQFQEGEAQLFLGGILHAGERQPVPGRAGNEVERIERYHRDHNEFEYDAPLFGTRGLFTTHV